MSTPIRPGFILGMLASIVLSPCAVAAPAPVVPAAGETREAIRDVLRGDARLDLKVNLAQKNQPLGEILAALGLQLQIPLAASRDTADDKVTVFLDQRPAAEVLMLLARHLDFRWYRRGDGYELGQSVASKQREAALSEQERKEQWAAISAQMERAARLAVIPRERLEARREAIRVQLQSRDLATEEYVRLTVEAETLHAVLYGEWGPAVAIYRSLTPRQVQELLGGREIRLSSADLTLPPAVAALVRQAQRVAARPTALSYGIPPDEALPPGDATAVIRLFDPLSTPVGLRPPVSSLQLEFLLPYSAGWGKQRWSGCIACSVEGSLSVPSPPSPAAEAKAEDPALKRTVELTLRQSRAPPAAVDEGERQEEDEVFGPGARLADVPTLGDVAEALHRVTGLEILADSFMRARPDIAVVVAPQGHPRPVVEILDTMAREIDYTWRKEGNLLLFRNRRYYRDRPEEVPDRVLHTWQRRVGRSGAATLDDLAELAAPLTDAQVRGLHQFWGWYFGNTPIYPPDWRSGGFYGARQHLRFWRSLSPFQRQSALAGALVPATGMTLPQRRAWVAALMAPGVWEQPVSELRRSPTTADVATGGFRLEVDPAPPWTGYTFVYHLDAVPGAVSEQKIRIFTP